MSARPPMIAFVRTPFAGGGAERVPVDGICADRSRIETGGDGQT